MQPFAIFGGIFAVSVTFAAIFLLWKLLHAVQQLAGNNAATLEQLAGLRDAIQKTVENTAALVDAVQKNVEQLAGMDDFAANVLQNNEKVLDAAQKMQRSTWSIMKGCAQQCRTWCALELACSLT